MMRKLVLVCLTLACFGILSSTPAQAEWLFGAGVGSSNVEADDFDDGDLGYKIFGGFRFFRHFGVEMQFVDLGEPEDSGLEIEVTHAALYGVGVIPVSEMWEIFGKLGYGRWDIDISDLDFEDDDIDIAWGLGVAVIFAEHVGARLEYERFEVDETDTVDFLSASIDIRL